MPASTIGKPVRPAFHASNSSSSSSTWIASNDLFQFHHALPGH